MTEAQQRDDRYPVSSTYKVLDGYDVYRSAKLIVALVVVESQFGRDLRLYRWQKRGEAWKVDLCRMSVTNWAWSTIAEQAKGLTEKYHLGRKSSSQEEE